MWMKIMACASLGAVLVFGAALVVRADRNPVRATPDAPALVQDDRRSATISTGEEVDLVAHTDPAGGWTVFNFTADW